MGSALLSPIADATVHPLSMNKVRRRTSDRAVGGLMKMKTGIVLSSLNTVTKEISPRAASRMEATGLIDPNLLFIEAKVYG